MREHGVGVDEHIFLQKSMHFSKPFTDDLHSCRHIVNFLVMVMMMVRYWKLWLDFCSTLCADRISISFGKRKMRNWSNLPENNIIIWVYGVGNNLWYVNRIKTSLWNFINYTDENMHRINFLSERDCLLDRETTYNNNDHNNVHYVCVLGIYGITLQWNSTL